MGAANLAGPPALDLSPLPEVTSRELAARIAAGEWVVDVRDRDAYAEGHLEGSVGIALSPQFATWLGWILPWGTPITLLGEEPDQIADARRQLARIGIDRPRGGATGPVEVLAGGRRTAADLTVTFEELSARHDRAAAPLVLDVRRDDEYAAGTARCFHIPLHQLLGRLGELPTASCGCTARAPTAPRSPPACSTEPATTSFSSPTTSTMPATSASPIRPSRRHRGEWGRTAMTGADARRPADDAGIPPASAGGPPPRSRPAGRPRRRRRRDRRGPGRPRRRRSGVRHRARGCRRQRSSAGLRRPRCAPGLGFAVEAGAAGVDRGARAATLSLRRSSVSAASRCR